MFDVRFTPESGHLLAAQERPLSAMCGLPHLGMLFSITKAALPNASAGFEINDKPEARLLFDQDISEA